MPIIQKMSACNAAFQRFEAVKPNREKRAKQKVFFVEGVHPIEQAVRLLGEHTGGGGSVDLGRLAIVGVTDGDSNPLTALYNVLIGESAASKSVAPEAFLAAAGSTVSIEVPSVGGDAPTGDETVEATLIDGEPAAFTDFTKSLKDEALCIEFTMPATTAEEAILLFAVTEGK